MGFNDPDGLGVWRFLADALRIPHGYRRKAFLQEGIHFRKKTPAPNSTWLFDRDRTLKAWAVAIGKEAA